MTKKSNILILLIILSLMLLGCSMVQVVQKVAEPIDQGGCRVDCRKCEFSHYDYYSHHCYCSCDGIEIQLY
ncbi:MAG: hypothetical protein ABID84_03595 [Chloroflexota bacterium]